MPEFLHLSLHKYGSALFPLLFLLLGLLVLTAGLAAYFGAPFHLNYWDLPATLLGLTVFSASCAGAWDGILIGIGAIFRLTRGEGIILGLWRMHGFFALGIWPWGLLILTAYGIVLSSNVTELNLALIAQGKTQWRDGFYWAFEADAIRWIAARHWALGLIDLLYLACWVLQIIFLLVLIVVSRSLRTVAMFSGSYLLLYFTGRWIGCLTPVLGPVFFQPELYGYLHGTYTQIQVDLMWNVIHLTNTNATRSGLLKGGLSAMPSLHVAMVSLCAWWSVKVWSAFRIPAILWVLATWYTTVGLGWHYVSDGLGGIVLMFVVVWLTRCYFSLWGLQLQPISVIDGAPRHA